MFRIVNLLMALSLGVHLEQFEQRIGLTCPRPFLLRPLYEDQHGLFKHVFFFFDAILTLMRAF